MTVQAGTSPEALLAANRERLFGIAYRMLGSVAEAEDVLQEAYLRAQRSAVEDLRSPAAWLTTVVGRLCLTRLTSARARRERYVGPWLPEPLLSDVAAPADQPVLLAESVSAAFLVVLESLSPAERVAFVLRDVFGYEYPEVAEILDRTPQACRQLVSRARRAVQAQRPRYHPDAGTRHAVATAFLHACQEGDLDALLELLAPDAVSRSDGGGKASAGRRPVHGAERIARMLLGLRRRAASPAEVLACVHGLPGLGRWEQGRLVWVLSLTVDPAGKVASVDIVTNPEKLAAVTPV